MRHIVATVYIALMTLMITTCVVAQTPPITVSSNSINFGSQTVGTTANALGFTPAGSSVAVGDFNHDNKLDLALSDGASGVNILLVNGDGTFSTPTFYFTGGNPDYVVVGDFNGDGFPDVAVANPNGPSPNITELLGNGDGTFHAGTSFSIFPTISLAVGDFNSDGFDDLLVGGLSQYDWGFLGSPTGIANSPTEIQFYGFSSYPWYLATGDFNGDGKLDYVAGVGPSTLSVLLGSGLGYSVTRNDIASTTGVALAAADMNGDGKTDLITTGGVYLGNGDGTFQPPITYGSGIDVGYYPSSITVGDFNHDNKPDVLIGNVYSSASVLLGNGDGTLQAPANYSGGVGFYGGTVATGDFNGDGKLDFVTTSRVVLGNGDGTFQSPQTIILAKNDPNQSLTLSGIPISGPNAGDFAVSSGCNVGDGLGAVPCFFTVTFTPAGSGARTAQLQFQIAGYPTPVIVNLNGTGIASDSTPPQIQCGGPDAVWHASDITISCSAADSDSGLANPADTSFALFTTVAAGTETANASTGTHQICDKASNCATAGPIGGNRIDKKSPAIAITSPAATSYQLNQSVVAQYQCTDGGSGVATCSGTTANNAPINTSVPGTQNFTVSAADSVGNAISNAVTYSVSYTSTGSCYGATGHQILQPINTDGTSVFKSGSTVPAKFRVCDANGVSVGAAGVVSSFNLVQIISGTVVNTVNETVNSSTPDNAFRWDPTAQQWIFNISTKGLPSSATYVYQVNLNDGSTISFQFGLK